MFAQRTVSVELMDMTSTWWNYHQHSVLFTTMEGYYQHPKAIISAFGNVQYHREISSPLEGTLSVLQKVLMTLEGKWMIDLLMSFCTTYDISLRH